jgi:hypothetical protein
VLTSPVTARGNAVDYKLAPFGQVDHERLV